MVFYASVDMVLGALPFVGDVLDFFSKANERNLVLFRRYASDPYASTADTRLFFIGLGLIFIGMVWLTIVLFRRALEILISVPRGLAADRIKPDTRASCLAKLRGCVLPASSRSSCCSRRAAR